MSYWVAIFLLLAAAGVSGLSERRVPDSLAMPLESISPDIAGWIESGTELLPSGVVRALKPTSYLARSYTKDRANLELLLVFYAQQRAGESMHSPKACLPAGGWEIWQRDSASIPIHGVSTRINLFHIQSSGQKLLVLYWYQSKRQVLADEYWGKLLLVKDTLQSGRTAGGLVRIMVPDLPGMAEQGKLFASAMAPQVERCFRE